MIKRDRQSYIINISKEYSIVSQFTSFVAIEEREKVGRSVVCVCVCVRGEWGVCVCGWVIRVGVSRVHSLPQDEKFDKVRGPSIDELVSQESVDKLSYMGWTVDQGKDPEKVSYIVTVCGSSTV